MHFNCDSSLLFRTSHLLSSFTADVREQVQLHTANVVIVRHSLHFLSPEFIHETKKWYISWAGTHARSPIASPIHFHLTRDSIYISWQKYLQKIRRWSAATFVVAMVATNVHHERLRQCFIEMPNAHSGLPTRVHAWASLKHCSSRVCTFSWNERNPKLKPFDCTCMFMSSNQHHECVLICVEAAGRLSRARSGRFALWNSRIVFIERNLRMSNSCAAVFS